MLVDLSVDVGPLSLSLNGVAYASVEQVAADLLALRDRLLARHAGLRPIVESLPGGACVEVDDGADPWGKRRPVGF